MSRVHIIYKGMVRNKYHYHQHIDMQCCGYVSPYWLITIITLMTCNNLYFKGKTVLVAWLYRIIQCRIVYLGYVTSSSLALKKVDCQIQSANLSAQSLIKHFKCHSLQGFFHIASSRRILHILVQRTPTLKSSSAL